jgi:4'-phosphopantetheinyl transferase
MTILAAQTIDIWFFPLTPWTDEVCQYLSQDETHRANKFYFTHHQQRFTMARAMMRLLLAQYLSLSASELVFEYSKYGKPYLSCHEEIEFNLSHSENWAVLGIGKKYPLGVDIEIFSERPYHGIGNHVFSTQENQALHKLPHSLKPLGFFSLWSQKEALIKACGLGLTYNTTEFNVAVLPPKKQLIWDKQHQKTWQIHSFMPRSQLSAALCCHEHIETVDYKTVLLESLLVS